MSLGKSCDDVHILTSADVHVLTSTLPATMPMNWDSTNDQRLLMVYIGMAKINSEVAVKMWKRLYRKSHPAPIRTRHDDD